MLTAGSLRLNLETRQVQNERGEIVRLTPKEARLLAVFMQYAGLTLSRRFLMCEVWVTSYVGGHPHPGGSRLLAATKDWGRSHQDYTR